MAKGDAVAPEEHIIRYLRKKDVHLGKANPSGFSRPEKDSDGLSACRLGILDPGSEDGVADVRAALSARLTLDKKGGLAELSVASIYAASREIESEYGYVIGVIEDALEGDPEKGWPPNPAHALMTGLPFIGQVEGSLASDYASDLLRRAVVAVHPTVAAG